HGTESLFYVSDRLGSVRETVNQDHLITARMSYTAYGETQTTLTPFIGKAPDYRYAGLFFHEQSGLYLAVFRAYDPSAGRWISRDPIGEDGGVNLYAYSKSVPINNNDSLGLSPNLSGFAKYELHKAIKFCAQPKNWISKELVSRVPGLQCFSELILAGQNKKRIRQECIAASTNPKSRFYGHPQSCEIIRPYSTFEGCIKFASTYGITDGGGK
ncbi:RHS repeat-associated core domain-containing protein, partial [Acidithiobacillus sp. VAN18-1]